MACCGRPTVPFETNSKAPPEAAADVGCIGPVWMSCQRLFPSVWQEGGGRLHELLHGVLLGRPAQVQRHEVRSVGIEIIPAYADSKDSVYMPALYLKVAKWAVTPFQVEHLH